MGSPFDTLLFVEDLVRYITESISVPWSPRNSTSSYRKHLRKAVFMPHIGDAVILLMRENVNAVEKCHNTLISKNITNGIDFGKEATITTVYFFNEGYDPLKYLKLCACLVGIGILYWEDCEEIMEMSVQLLSYIINFYIYHLEFNPRKSWFQLAYTAQQIIRNVKKFGTTESIQI